MSVLRRPAQAVCLPAQLVFKTPGGFPSGRTGSPTATLIKAGEFVMRYFILWILGVPVSVLLVLYFLGIL